MSNGIVERALNSLGKGFGLTSDFKLKYCKGKERLVLLNETHQRDINLPGFVPIKNVSIDIKCDKGDLTRSDILEFNEVCQIFSIRRVQYRGKFHQGVSTPCLTWRAVHGQLMLLTQSIGDLMDILSHSSIFIVIAILWFSLMKFLGSLCSIKVM
ncbi:hypothetical protein Patl1_36679 [Pistacia atlantica]|nr:hypothetical protein Patl1_36679 [Pistacia atlantica]